MADRAITYKDVKSTQLRDITGRRLTTGLFFDLGGKNAVFHLEDWYDMYIAVSDPTEYKAAKLLIGEWDYWLQLRKNPVLAKIFDQWRAEVEVQIKSVAVANIVMQAATDKGTAAARWLAEAGYKGKIPTKAAPKSTPATTPSRVANDAVRLGLVTPIKEKSA
jgi:hypothetical protein